MRRRFISDEWKFNMNKELEDEGRLHNNIINERIKTCFNEWRRDRRMLSFWRMKNDNIRVSSIIVRDGTSRYNNMIAGRRPAYFANLFLKDYNYRPTVLLLFLRKVKHVTRKKKREVWNRRFHFWLNLFLKDSWGVEGAKPPSWKFLMIASSMLDGWHHVMMLWKILIKMCVG